MRTAFVPIIGRSAITSDVAVEFFKSDAAETIEANKVFIKEVDKNRYTTSRVVELMQLEGYPQFNQI